MVDYRNFIFDLYGTLIDIHTDEHKPSLWRKMAHLFSVYGAEYSLQEMKEAYFWMAQEEERKLSLATGFHYSEIRLENVFRSMLLDKVPAGLPQGIDERAWLHVILNTFRSYSRERFSVFPGTSGKLEELKQKGCRLFLLSNAQASFTMPEMEVSGLAPYFEAIYLSSDHGMRKPQPEFLQKMIDEYGLVPAETVLIGNDAASDIVIADACGIDSILLNTWHETEEEIRKRFTDLQINALDRVRIILSGDITEV